MFGDAISEAATVGREPRAWAVESHSAYITLLFSPSHVGQLHVVAPPLSTYVRDTFTKITVKYCMLNLTDEFCDVRFLSCLSTYLVSQFMRLVIELYI